MDSVEYETIMIGATGSYNYENIDKEVSKIRIIPNEEFGSIVNRYKSGTINCCY
jgi:hypothetical protein